MLDTGVSVGGAERVEVMLVVWQAYQSRRLDFCLSSFFFLHVYDGAQGVGVELRLAGLGFGVSSASSSESPPTV